MVEGYYKDPTPQRALAYYIYYVNSNVANDANSFWGPFSIFLEIGRHNSFLSSQILEAYNTADLKTKKYLLGWLHYSGLGSPDFFNGLQGDEKEAWLQIKDSPPIDIYMHVSQGFQLDMLWGTFMASGSYMPILKLIQTLDYVQYAGSLDKFKTSTKTEEDRQKAINEAIYKAAVWSLKSNYTQHELIKEYCNWALQFENLSVVQKKELEKIIKQ